VSVADLPFYRMATAPSLATACAILAEENAAGRRVVLLAGGTDFMVEVSQGGLRHHAEALPLCIDVSRLEELRGIDWDGRRLRIGAAASYLAIQRHEVVRERAPLLARMTYDIGGPTIQARGTLGGNVATASPAADGVVAIAALDAVLEVASVRGRRTIPFAELQTGYKRSRRADDEIIVAVEIEPPAPGAAWCWRKIGTRRAQAISKVALAAVAEGGGTVERFGCALASVAPVTALMPTVRRLVAGARVAELDGDALDRAVETDVSPIDDLRSTRAYRLHCARALVRGFARQLGAAV
jgi:CO/xanthine dehydrogenase FAD-binding subunit